MTFRMKRISLLVVAVVVILAAAGCRNPFSRNGGPSGSRASTGAGTPVPVQICPIDGQPTTSELLMQRPLAVMIENSPKARPQSGLNDACVVYEAITEGGITRFLAIFAHGSPEVIGPVRSARPHFINLMREYEAAYVHCGQSQEALEILVADQSIYNLDQMKYAKPFWRDKSRQAPHNLYASAARLRAQAAKLGWGGMPTRLPHFTGHGRLTSGTPAPEVNISFGGAVKYKLQLVYDAAQGGYVRYMDGKLHVDRETGKPIVAANVLIQYVEAKRYPSNPLHTYDVTVTGDGAGHFISNGQATTMHWRKGWETELTSYTAADGGALPYLPGQTWIEVVPMEGKVTFATPAPAPAAQRK